MAKTEKKSKNVSVTTYRKANIAVIVVVAIAVALLVAIAVMCTVKIAPMADIGKPEYCTVYDLDAEEREPSNSETDSKLRSAMGDMKFSVMSAVLQWKWDYSYNFKRNKDGDKIELSDEEVKAVSSTETEYMVEYFFKPVELKDGNIDYTTAQSIKVDGETVYFDTLKIVFGDTAGKVGTVSLYPYIGLRIDNDNTDNYEISSETYKVTGINVRADTSSAYAAVKDLITSIHRG